MIRVAQHVDQFFVEKCFSGTAETMHLTRAEAHSLFEALGERLGRTFGAQSSEKPFAEETKR